MNLLSWLKRLFTPELEKVKADALREIDRALGKINSGQSATEVVVELRRALSALIAKSKLGASGALLADILLSQFNWTGLVGQPVDVIRGELTRLRKQAEGARL